MAVAEETTHRPAKGAEPADFSCILWPRRGDPPATAVHADSMTAPSDDELVRHARALRGLARALVGAEHADDVVQDAAVHALRRPPAAGVPLFAWLTGVVRNRARKLHRGERRRTARELRAGERADAADPRTPLDAAAHREAVARLDAALLALPQPYQDTLLWRYYEGMTPTEIASRTGVPVATVKSRLQRGLALMRDRLDGPGLRGEWRAALATAFGVGRAPVAVAAAAVTGILLMTAKLVVGALAAVLVGFFLWPQAEAPSMAPTAVADAGGPPSPMAGANVASAAEPRGQREAVTPAAMSASSAGATGAEFTIVGRCVDEAGTPLAGVRVEGTTYRPGGGIPRLQRDGETGVDGTFALALPVASDQYQSLTLRAADRCEVRGSIRDAIPGERRDLGDLVMPLAHRVRGRVVDATGTPQEGVAVRIRWFRSGPERRIVEPWVSDSGAVTDALGRFTIREDLPPGRYRLELGNRSLVDRDASHIELGGEPRERVLELVVEPAPPTCRGVVVRTDGSPIAGAIVSLDGNTVQTDVDGRFAVLPKPDWITAERPLLVRAPGFLSRNDHVWRHGDSTEQRIELRTAPAIVLRVVDGETGEPIERYAARAVPPNGWNDGQYPLRATERPGGVSRLIPPPGEWFVIATPDDSVHARSAFVPVTLPPDRDVELTVRVWAEQERRLVVTDGERPVAGVAVELLDPGNLRVRRDTETWLLEDCRVSGPPTARIVQTGATDGNGALVLRGPKADLALRLSGGGLALQIVQPIRLDEATDLVVAAQRGARLRGRLVPVEVARHVAAAADVGPNEEAVPVGIDLVGAGGEKLRRYLEPPFPIDAEGAFDIRGVPAGTLHIKVVKGNWSYVATIVDVPEGGEVERDVDIAAIAPAFVTLRVLVDGQAAKDAYVNAMGWHAKDSFGKEFPTQTIGRADESGAFRIETCVGDLELYVTARTPAGDEAQFRAYLHVPHAGPQEHVVDLRVGGLDLTVLRPDGTPAPDVVLREAGRRTGSTWTTDAAGRVRVERFTAGTLTLEARPRSLSTRESQEAFARTNGWQALQREWVAAGVLEIAPGNAVARRLVLPPGWDR